MRILFYNTYEKVFQNQDYPGKKSLMAVENITKLLGKICPIDRTEYIDHPFPIHPIPIPKAMPISLDECMFLRAKEISEITEKKKILWSGGIDSTALLVALLKYDSEFNYEIVCTPSSLKEYPWFFEKYIKQKKHCIIDEKNPTVFFKNIFDGSYIITGHLGDQLFMNFLIVEDDVFLASKLKYLFDKRQDINLVKVINNYIDFLDELSIIDIYDIILLDINL